MQISSYQKTIYLHKAQVLEVIDNLAPKGVNVTEINRRTEATKKKIKELDKRLEGLPKSKESLIKQYNIEKEKQ